MSISVHAVPAHGEPSARPPPVPLHWPSLPPPLTLGAQPPSLPPRSCSRPCPAPPGETPCREPSGLQAAANVAADAGERGEHQAEADLHRETIGDRDRAHGPAARDPDHPRPHAPGAPGRPQADRYAGRCDGGAEEAGASLAGHGRGEIGPHITSYPLGEWRLAVARRRSLLGSQLRMSTGSRPAIELAEEGRHAGRTSAGRHCQRITRSPRRHCHLSPRLRNRLCTALSSRNPLHLFNQAPNWATETG